ncbi:MAG: hypothetical protein HZA12_03450 [Nitrospirae bacterium]|nr:hypothetical protein [Nitrospirota bacterium]
MIKKTFLSSSLLLFLALSFIGCGQNIFEGIEDKGSGGAKQYAALKSLDSGDWPSVLEQCDLGTANPLDCSAAALGAAGLDPIDVAKKLNNLIDTLGTATTGDISAIGTLPNIDPSYLDEIHDANVQLDTECKDNGDEDACSQLVVTAIAEVVIAIAQVGESLPGVDLSDGIDAVEAEIIADAISTGSTVDIDGDGTATPVETVIETSALYIINNINASPFGDPDGDGIANTELGQVIEDQVQAMGGADCAVDSATTCEVTAAELESYLDTTYGSGLP